MIPFFKVYFLKKKYFIFLNISINNIIIVIDVVGKINVEKFKKAFKKGKCLIL